MIKFGNYAVLRKWSLFFLLAFVLLLVTRTRGLSQDEGDSSSSEEESVEILQPKMAAEIFHVDFEVFGEVQGVFFRKYTQKEATKLGLRGWCRNTSAGTVQGSMEGPREAIDKMKYWLKNTGSPMSRISNAIFKNENKIDSYSFNGGFDIARTT